MKASNSNIGIQLTQAVSCRLLLPQANYWNLGATSDRYVPPKYRVPPRPDSAPPCSDPSRLNPLWSWDEGQQQQDQQGRIDGAEEEEVVEQKTHLWCHDHQHHYPQERLHCYQQRRHYYRPQVQYVEGDAKADQVS